MAIGALGIFGVGTFAYFWKGKIGIWHYLFASSGFSLSALSFWLDFGDPWKSAVTGVAALLVLAASWNKNPILWVEVAISYCLLLFILI